MKDKTSKQIFFVMTCLAILLITATILSIKSPKTTAKAKTTNCQIYDTYVQAGGSQVMGDVPISDEATRKVIEKLEANTTTDPSLETDIAEIKAKIREKYGQYEFLDWERFDKTIAKFTSFNDKFTALYADKNNTLYVTEACRQDGKYHETCAHELIHALTTNAKCKKSIFYEGFVEYLAQQIYNTDSASYLHAFAFAETYVQKYGLEQALKDYMDNISQLDIDKQLNRSGASHDTEVLIYYVDHDAKLEAYPQSVILDVYYSYCGAIGIKPSKTTDSWLRLLLSATEQPSADIKSYLDTISK